jgi:hypothetical protein
MRQLPACPLCFGKLIEHVCNTNNALIRDVTCIIGLTIGTHSVDATCENGCHVFVQASKPGDPSELSGEEGSVPVRFRALRSGALKADW